MIENEKKCLHCQKEFRGRSDKKFCSTSCRNNYNYIQRKNTKNAVKAIDYILHRNRNILQSLMGEKGRNKMMVDRLQLDQMGFNFNYITGIYKNSQNKLYHYVYDYAWMQFSKQEIMIVRKKINSSK